MFSFNENPRQNMSKRKKIIITVIVALIFFIILVLLWWWLGNRQASINQGRVTNTNQGLQIPADLPRSGGTGITDIAISAEQQKTEANLKAVAMTFAERYGSYSNQGNFSNLADLNSIMTVRMKALADNYKISQQSKNVDSYYGITTKSLSVDILSLEENLGRASVTVTTQRHEALGSTINPRPFYQDIKIQLTKTGDIWKVDFVEWQ